MKNNIIYGYSTSTLASTDHPDDLAIAGTYDGENNIFYNVDYDSTAYFAWEESTLTANDPKLIATPTALDGDFEDFELQSDSPAINAGADLTGLSGDYINTDFYGTAFDSTPDIGAIQYETESSTPNVLGVSGSGWKINQP